MKKIVGFMIAGVAVVALSGCGPTNAADTTYDNVDISQLRNGYLITGDDNNNKNIELAYCGNTYELYHEKTTFSGTFNIKSSTNTINMFEKTPNSKASYRIDTVNGFLEKGEIYTIKENGYDITIESIRKDPWCR
jgi:hypothetical protein